MHESPPMIRAGDNCPDDTDTIEETSPPEPIALAPTTFGPIKVDNLPKTDLQLVDLLQLALPGWLTTIPAAMVIPLRLPPEIDPSARVVIDATGSLHVLTASLNTETNIFTRALQTRKWLCDHLPLVTASCRQLTMDPTSPVGIIMVTPNAESQKQTYSQITDFPCQSMQLMFLRTGQENSLLIIPT